MKSSMFTLWLITGVLSYAHKIPYIGRIITLLSLWYGRTTWWKLLLKLRRMFVTFNAIIGVYMVFKLTGFSTDNLLAGFAGMGQTYIEILMNFSKRLFHWFFELFDHKVVPNFPGEGKPLTPKNWLPGQIPSLKTNQWIEQYLNKPISKEWFNSPFGLNLNPTPWYKDLSTWLWIGGAITMAAGSLGAMYLVYKLTTDPGAIWSMFKSEGGSGPNTNVTPATPPTPIEGVDNVQANKILSAVKSIGKSLNKLNPYYWFITPSDLEAKHDAFILRQQDSLNYDNRFYPFTEVNPYHSTLHKWRISWLGENYYEAMARRIIKNDLLESWVPLATEKTNQIASSSKSLLSTPGIGTIGLGTADPYYAVANKLASLPSTPTSRILNLPHVNNPFDDSLDEAISRLTGSDHGSDVEEGSPSCEASLRN
jgi:hypothetical protein